MICTRKGWEGIMNGRLVIRQLAATLAIISLLLFSACSLDSLNWNPQGDWRFALCNDYYISRNNSSNILLGIEVNKEVHVLNRIIGTYISEFCYNERYIAVKQLEKPTDEQLENIQALYQEAPDYYLVDTQTEAIYGPFAEKEDFERACKEQNVGDLGEWIPTVPAPEGAEF